MSDAHDALRDDPVIGPLIGEYGEIELEPADDVFERLVTSIVNQVISTEAARTVRGRLFDAVTITPEGIIAADREELRAAGLSPQKVDTMRNVARWFDEENVTRERFEGRGDADVTAELTEISGIGDWTAKMFLMFVLGREDVFPIGDLAARRAVEDLIGDLTRAEMETRAEAWAPHRSVATLYLWQYYVDENSNVEDIVA
jgi:DNA-3-methyladenine glycosylase II